MTNLGTRVVYSIRLCRLSSFLSNMVGLRESIFHSYIITVTI